MQTKELGHLMPEEPADRRRVRVDELKTAIEASLVKAHTAYGMPGVHDLLSVNKHAVGKVPEFRKGGTVAYVPVQETDEIRSHVANVVTRLRRGTGL